VPVQLKEGKVDWFLDIQKEIQRPMKQGYYLESIAKIDAHIDVLLDALLKQKCPKPCCKALFQQTEKSVKGIYTTYVTGLHKANIMLHLDAHVDGIKTNVKLSKNLYEDIKRFKELRNAVLHSYRGQYNLISEHEMSGITSDEQFQKIARKKAHEVVNVGLKCHSELQALLIRQETEETD